MDPLSVIIPDRGTVIHKKCKYEWKINDLTEGLKTMSYRKCVESPIFSYKTKEGETKWRLKLYSSGDDEECENYLSLYLESVNNRPLTINYSFGCIHRIKKNTTNIFEPWDKYGDRQFIKKDEIDDLIKISGNDLTIFCEISSSNIATHTQANSLEEKMIMDISQLLEDNDLSDLKLIVGTKEFQAHKAILAARSTVFAAMLKSDMKEKRTSQVVIDDIEPRVFEVFLKFIYTSEVEITKEIAKDLMIVADRYAIEELKNLCVSELCYMINSDNVIEILMFDDLYGIAKLRDAAINFIITYNKDIINLPNYKLLEEKPLILAQLLRKSILLKK